MKKIIITILVIIFILLLGLIGYQYLNNDEEIIEDEKVEIINESYEGNNFSIEKLNYLSENDKIDISNPFVYFIAPLYDEIDYEGRKIPEFKNEFAIYNNEENVQAFPYININIDGIEKINYMLKAYSLVSSTAKEDYNTSDETYEFFANVFDDILSIYIKQTRTPVLNNIGINIDLKDKKILNLEDILNKKDLTQDDILESLNNERTDIIENNKEHLYLEKDVKDILKRILANSKKDYKIYNRTIDLNQDLKYYAERISVKDLGYEVHDWEFSKEYLDELRKNNSDSWTYSYSFMKDLAQNEKVCCFIDKDNMLNIIYRQYLNYETNNGDSSQLIIK